MEENADFKWKIVVIGDPAVGKTSLMLRYTQKTFRELYIPTVGVQVSIKTLKIDNHLCALNIWDIAGQQKFSNIRRLFYEGTDATIIVFDITDQQSFINSSKWHNDLPPINKKVGALIGNKLDLEDKRVISEEWGKTLSEKMGFQYFEISAKNGHNVENLFHYLAQNLYQKSFE